MKCDRCENEANIQIHIIEAGNEAKKLNLCDECAQQIMFHNMDNTNNEEYQYFQDHLKKLVGVFFNEPEEREEAADDGITCSACGSSFADITKTGRFGCDRCYTEFYDKAKETLRMTQGATSHTGDIPENYRELRRIQDEISRKKEELQELILSEDYEHAAVIRDEVKELSAALERGSR